MSFAGAAATGAGACATGGRTGFEAKKKREAPPPSQRELQQRPARIDALVDLAGPAPGLPAHADAVPVRTVSPPLVDSRSLHVRPHQHRFASRETYTFPSLIPRR